MFNKIFDISMISLSVLATIILIFSEQYIDAVITSGLALFIWKNPT